MLVNEITTERNELALGSYSSGTMRDVDLIPTFMGLFEEMDAKRAKSYRWANRKYFNFLENDNPELYKDAQEREEMLPEITQELFDILGDYCPPYTYFGSHPGDGADYGVWVSDDSIKDDIYDGILTEVNDLSEIDDMIRENGIIPKNVILVNDHGNETLYTIHAKLEDGLVWTSEEVWSIV